MISKGRSEESLSATIIGLGNEFLSDDGIGVVVVRLVAERLAGLGITFQELSVGGLDLLDHMVGFDRCIIVDALTTGSRPPGTMFRFAQSPESELRPIASSHQIDLAQVLELGRVLGVEVPEDVSVYGIEAEDVTTYRSGLTNKVAESVPALVDAICADAVDGWSNHPAKTGEWEIIEEQATH